MLQAYRYTYVYIPNNKLWLIIDVCKTNFNHKDFVDNTEFNYGLENRHL